MKQNDHHPPYADLCTVPSELSFKDTWDGMLVSELIRSKSGHGATPAFLFLGRKETALLREHLVQAFGEDAVATLNGTYYMGLMVVTIECESFVAAGGSKVARTLQDPISRRFAWQDRETNSLWQLRI